MKRKTWVITAVLLAFPWVLRAENAAKIIGKAAWYNLKQTATLNLRALENVGGGKGNRIIFTNKPPLEAMLVIFDKPVALMKPGSIGRLTRKFVPLRKVGVPIPVMVLYFDPSKEGQCVGAAMRTFRIDQLYSVESWIMDASEIRTPSGQYLDPKTLSTSTNEIETQEVKYPRHWLEERTGTLDVQIMNVNNFTGTVLVNGEKWMEIQQFEMFTHRFENNDDYLPSYDVSIQIVFRDSNGVQRGGWSTTVGVPRSHDAPEAFQAIIGPNDLDRQARY